jgi:hypothetical protein
MWIGVVLLLAFAPTGLARQAEIQVSAPSVDFLDRAAAARAIVDESMEPYFKLLQPMEMRVKTGEPIGEGTIEQQQRDRCRQRYQKVVEYFTGDEQDALRWYVSKLEPLVAGEYPLYARTPWSFIKLNSKMEGGMPHTRGGHIVLSEDVLAELVQSRKQARDKQDPEWMGLTRLGEVLLHEQSHVVQRKSPALLATLYTRFWKFKHAASVQGCDWLTQHQIVNPDGVDTNWVYPIRQGDNVRWIWPLIVLDSDDTARASFADMRMIAVELEATGENTYKAKVAPNGKPIMRDLISVADYVSVFSPSRNIYHPNEAAADLFARIVIGNSVLPGHLPRRDEEKLKESMNGLTPLKDWFDKIFALPR